MKKTSAWLLAGYVIASLGLFLYSFTQVDLSLTLTQVGLWQSVQKAFQYIGFYARPLSTGLYIGLLIIFFGLYAWTLRLAYKGNLSRQTIWTVIWWVSVILLLSYPAFSYDLFNYMFNAKTILVYHKNPYAIIPMEFTGVEPWLSFLRWTHIPTPYTPLSLLLTIPFYILGFGNFLFTMWNMKLIAVGGYVLTAWGIEKTLGIVEPKRRLVGLTIFALNPLIIIESLVSGHHDIVMMAPALFAYYFYLKKDQVSSLFMLAVSIANKLTTFFLLPAYVFRWNRKAVLTCMCVGLASVLLYFRRELLPWYLVWIIPFVALLPALWQLTLVFGALSLGLLLHYAPYLYLGHWNDPVPSIKIWVTVVPTIISLLTAAAVLRNPPKRT